MLIMNRGMGAADGGTHPAPSILGSISLLPAALTAAALVGGEKYRMWAAGGAVATIGLTAMNYMALKKASGMGAADAGVTKEAFLAKYNEYRAKGETPKNAMDGAAEFFHMTKADSATIQEWLP